MLWSVVMLTLFSQTSNNHWQLLCNIPKCSNDFCASGVRNFSTRHKHKNIHLHMQTHATSARLQHHRPFISPHSPQVVVVVGGVQMKVGVSEPFSDVKVPPPLAASLLTERAIWAAESLRQAHPSLCPALWACSQRDRLGALAGIRSPDLLAKLEHVLMILAFSWVRNAND